MITVGAMAVFFCSDVFWDERGDDIVSIDPAIEVVRLVDGRTRLLTHAPRRPYDANLQGAHEATAPEKSWSPSNGPITANVGATSSTSEATSSTSSRVTCWMRRKISSSESISP